MTKTDENIPMEEQPMDMKLDVHVKPIAPKGNLLAFASVTINDSFKIDNFRICSGERGLYAAMPSIQDGQGRWRDACWPVTAQFRKQLNDALVDGYAAAIESLQATLDATRGAADRPSLTGALKAQAEAVSSQPPKPSGKSEPTR